MSEFCFFNPRDCKALAELIHKGSRYTHITFRETTNTILIQKNNIHEIGPLGFALLAIYEGDVQKVSDFIKHELKDIGNQQALVCKIAKKISISDTKLIDAVHQAHQRHSTTTLIEMLTSS